jgi:DNA (cytosine-5)-methyltransferase 1
MGPSKKSPTVVSLFSGCGGLDLGFHQEGFRLVYASDNDPAAVRCYAANIDNNVFLRDVSSQKFHDDVDEIGKCDVVLGGFPCQGFSKAGPKKVADPRNILYVEMKRAVERLAPSVFIAENVDGMSQNFGGEFVDRILNDFRQLGYLVENRILQAADFGLPQYRRRIFFVGVKKSVGRAFVWPVPTHSTINRSGEFIIDHSNAPLFDILPSELPRARSIADAIGDLLENSEGVPDQITTANWPKQYSHIFRAVSPGQKLCNVRHAPTSVYTWNIPNVFGPVTERQRLILETISKNRRHKKYGSIPNGNPLPVETIQRLSGLTDIVEDVQDLVKKKYLKPIDSRYDLLGAMFCSGLFKRPLWDTPAPTVLTVFDNPRYFVHPLKDRPFTVRECARLQGFPDTFRFCEGTNKVAVRDAYRLVGNAVPPPLGRKLAQSVKQIVGGSQSRYKADENETPDTQSAA